VVDTAADVMGEAEDMEDTDVEDGLLSGVFLFSDEARGWLIALPKGDVLACLLEGEADSPLSDLALFGDCVEDTEAVGDGFEVLASAADPIMLDSILLQA